VKIRLGYELIYRCPQPTPMILNLNIHYTRVADLDRADYMLTDPGVPLALYRDGFGNLCTRLVVPAGLTRITADAVINDRGLPEPTVESAQQHPVESLLEETLVYLLSGRFCDTEHLPAVAWNLFGNTVPGWSRVQAICHFVNRHITFDNQFAHQTKTASEAFHERRGLCLDFAHLAIAFCRCLNIPARYCTGYLGDIGIPPGDAPMDFAGWFEAFMGDA
jgi:transglutaminase-like putative cysteine protease